MTRLWIKLNLKISLSLFLLGTVVVAQAEACPEIVQAALDTTAEQCSATGRNQACYGNVRLAVVPRPGINDFNFSTPGDIVAAGSIGSMSLSSKVEETDEWGVVLMKLQANLPDALPGQNITFLLFGDVRIQNGVESNTRPATLNVTARGSVDVRSGPSTGETRLGGLLDGDTVTALGRNAAGNWLRVSLNGLSGWVLADEVETAGDIQVLSLVDSAGLPLTPMQAFYFQSGIGDAPCPQAPDSGILVQTPQGVEQVQFTVDDVNITLGSTMYLQAQAHGELSASVVEGEARVESASVVVDVPAGSRVRVPIDDQSHALGAPSEPEPYDGAKLAVLPIRILPGAITIASPISAESTAEALGPGGTGGATLMTIGNQADWVDSGITVSAGQTFTVEAHGRMNPCSDTYPNGAEYCVFYAPEGGEGVVRRNNEYGIFPALGQRFMALLGRIGGNGSPFYVGAGGTFTAEQTGTLRFTPNDNTRTDNRGTYSVLVSLGSEHPGGG
jgi:SH3 domain-containing protein